MIINRFEAVRFITEEEIDLSELQMQEIYNILRQVEDRNIMELRQEVVFSPET